MFAPVYEKESGRYIILNADYTSEFEQEAMAKGVIGQLALIDLDYLFVGECVYLTQQSKLFLTKETSPYSGIVIELGLVGGKLFDELSKGNKKPNEESVTVPDKVFNDPIFIIEIIAMNDESNVTVGIGYDKENYTPYVLILGITQDEAMTTEKAREIGSHLIYASEASEMDSFIRRALDEAYGDDEMSKDKKNALLDAIRHLREEERNEKNSTKEAIIPDETTETIEDSEQAVDGDATS